MSGMGRPLISMIHIVCIYQVLIVPILSEYRRNRLVGEVESGLEIA
jgi:hypothetical protein